jgi:uncharacterized membrane protein
MSKRKKNKKRSHKRNSVSSSAAKPASPSVTATTSPTEPTPSITTQFPSKSEPKAEKATASQSSATSNTAVGLASAAEWVFVSRDVRRIGILAAVCIGLQLALAYLFSHTGLGDSVYFLIKL